MTDKILPRKEKERLRHRKEILNASLELFSEKGFHNVSMQEIAVKAEFGTGTLYNFFKNKEELYVALMLEQADKFQAALRSALKEGRDEYEMIINFIRVKGEVFMANEKVIRLFLAETQGASFNIKTGLDDEIRRKYDECLQELTSVFHKGIEKKIFKKLDPLYLANSLDSVINSFLLFWLESPKEHPYEKNIKVIEEMLFAGMLNKGRLPR